MDSHTQTAGLAWLLAALTTFGASPGLHAAPLTPDTDIPGASARTRIEASAAVLEVPGLGRGMALRGTPNVIGLRLDPMAASPADAVQLRHLRAGLSKTAFTDARPQERPAAAGRDVLRLLSDCVAVDARGACQPGAVEAATPRPRTPHSHARTAAANGVALLTLVTLWQRLAQH